MILLASYYIKGQSYQFRRLSVDQGLSQSAIFTAYQDHEGYLWFGTLDGLNRYDGHSFEIYRNQPGDSTSIGSNEIFTLTECPDKKLWIGTSNGISVYDAELREFKQYRIPDDRKGARMINKLESVGDSILLVGTNAGLHLLRYANKQFSYDVFPALLTELSDRRIYDVVAFGHEIWVATSRGLIIYDSTTGALRDGSDRFSIDDPKNLLVDGENKLWILEPNRIHQLSEKGELLYTHTFEESSFAGRQAIVDQGDFIWFSAGGLRVLDKRDYSIQSPRHKENDPTSLSSNLVTALCVSDNGIVWVGTPGLGINQYDPKAQRLSLVGSNERLIPKFIRAVHTRDDKQIFVSTNKSIEWFDVDQRQFHSVYNQSGESLRSTDFFFDLGNVLLAGGRRSLYLIQTSGQAVEITVPIKAWTAIEWKGEVYFGASGGLYRMSKTQLLEIAYGKKPVSSLIIDQVSSYQVGKINQLVIVDGYLWLITNNGVKVYDGNHQIHRFESFYPELVVPEAEQNTRSIHLQYNGTIWLASANNGIVSFDPETNSVRRYNEQHGLSNNNVYGILEDKSGDLWVSTNNGLSKFVIADERFLNYSGIHGLQSREFNSGAYFKSVSGMMYFGGVNGLNYFKPENIVIQKPPETTRIVSFLLNHEEIQVGKSDLLRRSIDKTDTLHLDHDQNSFEFQFANINFRDGHANTYQYRLVGFDEDWIEARRHNTASYTNMMPGTYEFRARAINSVGGVPQNGYASLVVIISEPFWRSALFRFLLATVILLLLVATVFYMGYKNQVLERLVRERTSEIEAQRKLLVERNKALSKSLDELKKTQAMLVHSEKMASIGTLAAGLGHEINNPLNFIKGGLRLLGKNLEGKSKETESFVAMIESGVRRINRLVNSVQKLGESRLGEKRPCEIKTLIEDSLKVVGHQFGEKVIVSKAFDEKDLYVKGYNGELQQALCQIFTNAEQSIDQDGEIHVATAQEGAFASIRITDSGEGIDVKDRKRVWDPFYTTKEPGKGEGLGLPIAYSVIKNHRGSISLESRKGEGTSITIKLPLSQD